MEGRKSPELANLFRQLHVDDTTLGQVVEIGRDVESLLGQPGWQVVAELLTELRRRGVDQLTLGAKPLEQAEYAQRLGFLNGVQTALDAAQTVIELADETRRRLEEDARLASESR
jgi:hypothetical protein